MDVDAQRRLATLLLDAVGSAGFALAGSCAIREHGLINRPTHDIDLFASPTMSAAEFQQMVDLAENTLQSNGYRVQRSRSFPSFARLRVEHLESGDELEVDFGINWRAHLPVTMQVGPVLSGPDAVAGKLSAVYSRGEVRDYLDLDAIRESGQYGDSQLLALGKEQDAGFDIQMFAQQLSRVADVPASYAAQYGVGEAEFATVQARLYAWAKALRDGSAP